MYKVNRTLAGTRLLRRQRHAQHIAYLIRRGENQTPFTVSIKHQTKASDRYHRVGVSNFRKSAHNQVIMVDLSICESQRLG